MLKNIILLTNLSMLLFPLPIFNQHIYSDIKDDFKNNGLIEYILNDVNDNYGIPDVSSQIENFPWRNDKDFLQAKSKYNTPFLMAGYCAVLKNPLHG